MRKTALILTLISALLFSVVAGIELLNVAKANPFFPYKNVDPIPGAIPPPIVISNPQNYTVYSSDEITVSFNISEAHLDEWFSSVISVEYSLDDEKVVLYDIYGQDGGPLPEFNTSFSLVTLSAGSHSLTVKAGCVFRRFVSLEGYFGEIFYIDSTSTTFFTIGTETPTPEPESFPTTFVIASPVAVAAVIAGLGLLVYLIKRK